MLLNTVTRTISIPVEKNNKALRQLMDVLNAKKVMVLQLQRLTGLLNFILRAIAPGRAFTRSMYAKYANVHLKQHYRIRVDKELRLDCDSQPLSICRPFIDFSDEQVHEVMPFFYRCTKG